MAVIPPKACGNRLEMLLRQFLGIIGQGKVRDTYALPGYPDKLLVVATDRLIIFDIVLNVLVPYKGEVLTAMVVFWLTGPLKHIKNHLVAYGSGIDEYLPEVLRGNPELQKRAIVIQKVASPIFELIVRHALTGSGLKDYKKNNGIVAGFQMPPDLHDGSLLPAPFFSPSTKATDGHDVNITADEVRRRCGIWPESIALYSFALGSAYCRDRGIIVADTKFEVEKDEQGEWWLIDEVLTPDSSRFWDLKGYVEWQKKQKAPPGYDKQPVRDWGAGLTTPFKDEAGQDIIGMGSLDLDNPEHLQWAHAQDVPDDIISATSLRYRTIQERLIEPLEHFQQGRMGIELAA